MKKLYVGNLPFSITEQQMKDLFSAYGEITEATVVTDKYTGRSRGFGFVTLSDDEAAAKAITEMNGKDIEGRQIVVNEAKPMGDRPAGGGGFRGRGGGRGGSSGGRGGFRGRDSGSYGGGGGDY